MLKPKPDARSVAAEPTEPHRHLGGDARGFRQNAVERLAGYPQLPRRFADRQTEGGKDVFSKDGSRVNRWASAALNYQFLRNGILLTLDSRILPEINTSRRGCPGASRSCRLRSKRKF